MKDQFTAAVLREHYAPLSIETLKAETNYTVTWFTKKQKHLWLVFKRYLK